MATETHALPPIENSAPYLPLSPTLKRPRDAEQDAHHAPIDPPRKRRRSLSSSTASQSEIPTKDQAASTLSIPQQSHISHWAEEGSWPEEYFQPHKMYHLLARKKSTASLRRKRSESSLVTSVTPSDQRPREQKSAPYMSPMYETLLESMGNSYMKSSKLGITEASKALCQGLLEKKYDTPRDTIFRDDVFQRACENLQGRNESRVVLDLSRLLVPSAEALALLGAEDLDILTESVNEGWNCSVPVTPIRPQPDFSVGFRRYMFSDGQFKKLQPLLGELANLSYLKATFYMYFPFLTCEVKCGSTGLDIADRQNAHSMTLAVRGIVELFRLAKREHELHREILTFSISHDHGSVRLYGHYAIIDGPKTSFHRYPIHRLDIAMLEGKEKWTTYNFTIAVYRYSLTLLARIRTVIDELPPDFATGWDQQTASQVPQNSTSSQQTGNQLPQAGEPEPLNGSSGGDLQPITPETSTHSATKRRRAFDTPSDPRYNSSNFHL